MRLSDDTDTYLIKKSVNAYRESNRGIGLQYFVEYGFVKALGISFPRVLDNHRGSHVVEEQIIVFVAVVFDEAQVGLFPVNTVL